jgi:Pyruvate/2-oxoacid:ferredoxin oxidoreductase delta subunit
LVFRGFDPCYALISRHGADITLWAYVVSGVILAASLFIAIPFCRWFCPLAAVLNIFSRFGIARVQRDASTCRDCGLCAKQCPMAIAVDKREHVTAARCLSCLNCIESCRPRKDGSRSLRWGLPTQHPSHWSQAALILILLVCTSAAVAGSYLFPIPSFVKSRGEVPEHVARLELEVGSLTCRGRANLLYYFLDRDDRLAIDGYLRVEAWPGPLSARLRVSYDPALTDEAALKQAITEPYYDVGSDYWRNSPFQIEGYDPLAADLDLELDLESLPSLP